VAVQLSVVIPVLNEAAALPALFRELFPVLEGLDCGYEVLFVNDGSTDDTLQILNRAAADDPRVKVLSFPRNFGHQTAITAGSDFSSGDAVIVMDADLQDPPALIPEMVRLWREGFDVVSPQRVSRPGDGWVKRKTASLFYMLMRKLVDRRIPKEVGDFRLLSRRAVDALSQFREEHRFLRGMIAWLGLREAMLPFERQARSAGETKFTMLKMLRFSWTAICSFSALPLRMTMWLGLLTSALGMGYLAWAGYMDLVRHQAIWGWTSLVFLQCFFFGVTLICISLIGEYVARIYEESKRRPLYVVERAINLSVGHNDVSRAVVLAPQSVEVNAGRI
jgi:glycosyltransferase involved in cell wall biosynthesis